MPIDGTYGRLKAHKQRMEDFRRKKEGRKKLSEAFRLKSKDKIQFKEVDKEQLEAIKKQIRKNSNLSKLKEYLLYAITTAIVAIIIYLLS